MYPGNACETFIAFHVTFLLPMPVGAFRKSSTSQYILYYDLHKYNTAFLLQEIPLDQGQQSKTTLSTRKLA
jgi:hypothetical protein